MVRFFLSSSRIRRIFSKERTIPPAKGTAPPESPVPAPLGVTGMRFLFAYSSTADTCSVVSGKTTASAMYSRSQENRGTSS